MNNIIIFIIIFTNSAIGFSQYAEFDFLGKTTHKWAKTHEGEILKHTFIFKNSGKVPLIINDAKVSCGCTNVQFPTHPILPGQIDSIFVTFDTNNKYYLQDRKVKLIANTKKETELRIKVFIIPKEE